MNRMSRYLAATLLLTASAAGSAADLMDKAASATNLKIFSAAVKSAGFNETLGIGVGCGDLDLAELQVLLRIGRGCQPRLLGRQLVDEGRCSLVP